MPREVAVSLSDHEKRVLDELERGLYADDAKFAHRVATGKPATSARIIGGALLALAGISVLVLAAVTQIIFFGVMGFLAMLAGVIVATSGQTAQPKAARPASKQTKAPKKPGSGTFFEDRFGN